MKWFKHDSNAHTDAKLEKVLMRYGSDGYALYWMCIELIAQGVDQHNLTFELEHDAEILGYRLKIDQMRVSEIMTYMISLDLFQSSDMAIHCYKLAQRVDVSMFPPNHRERVRRELNYIISGDESLTSQEESVINHDESLINQERLDKIRSDKNNKTSSCTSGKRKASKKYSPKHLEFAKLMYERIKIISPHQKFNGDVWAEHIRKLAELDGVSLNHAWRIFDLASRDNFWSSNILSSAKFRKQFPQLEAKFNDSNKNTGPNSSSPKPQLSEGDRIRAMLEEENTNNGD